jgi:hypothetical protein
MAFHASDFLVADVSLVTRDLACRLPDVLHVDPFARRPFRNFGDFGGTGRCQRGGENGYPAERREEVTPVHVSDIMDSLHCRREPTKPS